MSNTKEIIAVTIIAGPDFSLQPGKRAIVAADFADALIAGGYATLANQAEASITLSEPETAAIETPETATAVTAAPKPFAKKK